MCRIIDYFFLERFDEVLRLINVSINDQLLGFLQRSHYIVFQLTLVFGALDEAVNKLINRLGCVRVVVAR